MAMLNCPQCGSEVNKYAKYCPECKYEVSKIIPLSVESMDISVNSVKKSKRLIIIGSIVGVVTLITVMVVALLIISSKSLSKRYDDGLYKGLEWGTSYEDVKAKMPNLMVNEEIYCSYNVVSDVFYNDDNIFCIINNFDGFNGLVMLVTYEFDNDKLRGVKMKVHAVEDEETDLKEIYLIYKDMFNEKFDFNEEFQAYVAWEKGDSLIEISQSNYLNEGPEDSDKRKTLGGISLYEKGWSSGRTTYSY